MIFLQWRSQTIYYEISPVIEPQGSPGRADRKSVIDRFIYPIFFWENILLLPLDEESGNDLFFIDLSARKIELFVF